MVFDVDANRARLRRSRCGMIWLRTLPGMFWRPVRRDVVDLVVLELARDRAFDRMVVELVDRFTRLVGRPDPCIASTNKII